MVQRYTEGFRSGDLAQIVSCLTEDVVWAAGRAKRREKSAGRAKRRGKSLHGMKTLTGKDAFAAEVDAAGGPTQQLYLDRLIEEGDTVAVVGHGSVDMGSGEPVDFVYSEVFTFRDGLVSRLDTFHVWLDEVPAA
jgi:ketosteroid isomerase-like protein